VRVPRNYSGAYTATSLLEHIVSASATVAICVKITPSTGSIIGFTSTNSDLPISGVTYRAATGVSASQLETAAGTHAANMELTTILSSNGISAAEIETPKWQGASVEVFLVNYEALTMGELVLVIGRLADFKTQVPLIVTAEARGLNNALLNQVGRVTAVLCDADFGDDRCGLDLVALGYVKTAKAITTVTSTSVFRVASLIGTGVDYFKNGKVEIETGSNAGLGVFEVKTFDNSNGEFVLHRPVPYALTTSDTIKATRGCLKRVVDCSGYNNIENNRSFPFVPLEQAMRVTEAGQ
jgi:uncharacterized phage protein (TIGR02218 family)